MPQHRMQGPHMSGKAVWQADSDLGDIGYCNNQTRGPKLKEKSSWSLRTIYWLGVEITMVGN